MTGFNRILIANRGEIAVRIIRAAREVGIESVAVYSEEDRGAFHARLADEAVEIGPGDPAESYLHMGKLIDAAQKTGAEAIHPGYGFLSESAAFAAAVAGASLVWIGPPAGVIEKLGSKRRARLMARDMGIPLVSGFSREAATDAELLAAAPSVGFPLLVKAANGGGGKGMQVVRSMEELPAALARGRREAQAAFGSDEVLIEKFVAHPRHVEVQILADGRGNVVHLGERDCSIQRRHQKIVEESPAPHLTDDERAEICRAAVRLAEEVGYVGAGTVEFLWTSERTFHFLEVNTRLQVEHPVTEMRTGIDIVKWQFRIAAGERLDFSQREVRPRGAAIEVRVCAENPDENFSPCTGVVEELEEPAGAGIRVDSGLWAGQTVGARYDSLLAKIIAWGQDRREASARLRRALADTVILGCPTNIGFLGDVLASSAFREMSLSTDFLERHAGELAEAREERRRRGSLAAAALAAAGEADKLGRAAKASGAPSGSAPPAADPWNDPRLAAFRLGRAP